MVAIMSNVTIAQALAQITAWEAASLALAKGQSYSIEGRTLTRNDGQTVRDMLSYWQRVHNSLTAEAAGQTTPVGFRTPKWV